ncbi:MAG TPA: hypothetical protein VK197_09045, partial [Verrucomicrobiae bacterium]|nr:hypothetical protein [Verrucomicrobiae bacterium]
ADAYQAMTAERPYRGAMSSKAALKELRANAGTQFNPVVVEAFIATVEGDRRVEHAQTDSQQIFQQALQAIAIRSDGTTEVVNLKV